MKEPSSLVVEFLDSRDLSPFPVGLRVVGLLDNGNPCAVGQFFDCIDERKVLILHDEGEGIATRVAAKAFVKLSGRVDIERWSLFSMEGAVDFKSRSRPFEGKVRAYKIDNIRRGEDLFDRFWRNAAHLRIVNRKFGLHQLWVSFYP